MNKQWMGLALVGLLSWTGAVSANLVVNGGFEDKPTGAPIGGGSGWDYYDADSINGWEGDNLELWIGRNPSAYEGNYHAELNAHGQNSDSWSIFQSFDTEVGVKYNLTFAYSARRGDDQSSKEAFRVTAGDLDLAINDHVKNDWFVFDGVFTALSESTTLMFESIFPYSRTAGNFLDDIQVTQVVRTASVPEPSPWVLLSLGLLGLGALRKRAV